MSHMLILDCTNPIFTNGQTKVTYGYMDPAYGANHYGADLTPGTGTEEGVVAIEDGEVIASKNTVNRTLAVSVKENWKSPDVLGNYVTIRHGNGYLSRYCHMKFGSVCVKVGDRVKRGEKIGIIGSTGLSTGAHVHFEIWTNEKDSSSRVDPEPYITGKKSFGQNAPRNNAETSRKPAPAPQNAVRGNIRELAYDAILRSRPSSSSERITKIPAGEKIELINAAEQKDAAGGYIYICVNYRGRKGWIVKSALR